MSNINLNLSNAIKLSKFTQAELAKKVGETAPKMSQAVMHGLRFPEKTETKIAKLLGTTRAKIFGNGHQNENND